MQLVLKQDGLAYLAQYGDVRSSLGQDAGTALRHFCEFGQSEARNGFEDSLALMAVLPPRLRLIEAPAAQAIMVAAE